MAMVPEKEVGGALQEATAPEKELLIGVEVAEQERLQVPGNGARKSVVDGTWRSS